MVVQSKDGAVLGIKDSAEQSSDDGHDMGFKDGAELGSDEEIQIPMLPLVQPAGRETLKSYLMLLCQKVASLQPNKNLELKTAFFGLCIRT
eukprot:9444811-Ditylum_brightwellii.AAC.1